MTYKPLATADSVAAAARRIASHIHRTPLHHSRCASLDSGLEVFLKAEVLQKTGCFKPRGALNKVLQLGPEERARGVLTASAGNHAQGLAYAAAVTGTRARVVMPVKAQPSKIQATRSMGVEVELYGDIFHDALARALEIQRETGMTFVHPCIDPEVVAGAGTIGLEILEDLPDVDAIVVPIGGGGLISGIAAAVKAHRPAARVFGVEPLAAPAMQRSLRENRLVKLDTFRSIADGMAGPSVFQETLDMCRELVEDVLLVSEESMLSAIQYLLSRAKLLTEAAGAAPLAAILDRPAAIRPGSKVVAVLSGGNQDLGLLAGWLGPGLTTRGGSVQD